MLRQLLLLACMASLGHCTCYRRPRTHLKVITLNAYLASYCDAGPDDCGDYDTTKVVRKITKYFREHYPNAALDSLFDVQASDESLAVQTYNPALYKAERLSNIGAYLIENHYDVVFLQEVWFRQDYEQLKAMLEDNYDISAFDDDCGRINPAHKDSQLLINCNGLVTLVTKTVDDPDDPNYYKGNRNFDAKYPSPFDLPKGNDSDTVTDTQLYSNYAFKPKALVHDVIIREKQLRLINLHLTAYSTDVTEYRALREAQVDEVMNHALRGSDWRVAIVGMDMNDFPEESVYQKFLGYGFVDAFNPHQKSGHVYPETWAVDGNTFTDGDDPVTLDYIMMKRNFDHRGKVWFDGVSVDDFKTSGTSYSFSDHNAVSADITYFEPCQYA